MPSSRKNLFISAAVVLALVYCALEARGSGDLLIFITAGGDLGRHLDIFSRKHFDSYHYYYSVLFALLLRPLESLPYYGVKFAWIALNLFLFLHLMGLLWLAPAVQSLGERKARWLTGGVFLFSLRFLHENLHASQITIVILWLTINGLLLIGRGREIRGALLLAAGINIKLLPLVFLPYLLYRGYLKAFAVAIAALLAGYLLPSLFIGHAYNMFLLESWWHLVNPANAQHIMDTDERSFHSLTTLLTTLFIEHPPDPLAMPLRRNIADVPVTRLATIILAVRAVFILATLFFLRGRYLFTRHAQREPVFACAYVLLLIPLIFPHQQHYAFIFIVPAFALTLHEALSHKKQRSGQLIGLSIVYLLCNLKILLGEFNRYYEHYKILTYGAVLLAVLLARAYSSSRVPEERNIAGA